MIVSTEYGNFGNFKDLQTFMRLENKETVKINSADYWGIECIISKNGLLLSKGDVDKIVNGEV